MSNTRDTGFLRNAIQVTDQGVTFVSGSTTLMSISSSGAVTTTGVISGSNALSSSFSLNSALLNGIGSVGFATTGALMEVSSSQQQISSSLLQVSSSQQQISASLLNVVANYATTGSNSFRANQSITGSLVVSSTITAQTLVVQTVTSSIVYSSGSNLFGSALGDRQTFTGSVNITGSMSVTGSAAFSSDVILPYSKALAFNSISNQYITADSSNLYLGAANLARLTISSSGLVGIGTTSPNAKLHINGSTGSPTYRGFVYTYAGNETLTDEVLFQAVVDGYSSVYPLYLFRDQRTTQTSTQRIFEIQGGISGVGTILTTLANGYVGIGTTSPAEKLHVSGGAIKVQGDTAANTANAAALSYASGYASLNSWGPNTSTWGGIKFILNASNGNANTAMTISGSGNVGIGTTSPTYTLDVNGTGRFSSALRVDHSTAGAYAAVIYNTSATGQGLTIRGGSTSSHSALVVQPYDGSTTLLNILSTGAATFSANSTTLNVNTSTRVLEVTGKNSYYATQIIGGSGTGISYGLSVNAGTNSSDVAFQVYNQTESAIRLLVRGDGNVGIGTTSPAYKFVVSNGGAAGLEVDPVTPTVTGGVDLLFYNRSTSAYKAASFLASQFHFSNNVGIGITTPATLDSGGVNLQIKDRSALFQLAAVNSTYLSNNVYYDGSWKRIVSGYGALIRLNDDNNGFSFLTTGTDAANSAVTFTSAMNITSGGNVGIGSTSPARKLIIYGGTTNAGLEILSANGYRTAIIAGGASSGTGADQGYFQMTDQGTAKVVLNTAGDSYLTGGSLGVGLSNPLATLATLGGAVQIMGDYRNHATVIRSAGANGTFNGSLVITIPEMSTASTDGYGGYSCEVYVAGYSGFYCHAWFGGYINGGIVASEATILRSNGGWSISQTSYGTSNQGFQFTIDYPSSIVHPTARVIFNKGGSPNSTAYPANSITTTFS